MDRSKKPIGVITYLDETKHLSVKQVASNLDLTGVAVWKAMKIGKLKYVMAKLPQNPKHYKQSGFIRVTTQEWVDAWRATKADKNHQRFNGKQMYDISKGELSSAQVRTMLGWTKNKFMYYVYRQYLKYTQKGYYYVFYLEDVQAFMAKMGIEYKGDQQLYG